MAERSDQMTDQIRMRVLFSHLGTIKGLHTTLDHLRDKHKMVGGYPSDRDYNIEMAQQALETASMRLQQVVGLTDPKACSPALRPCSDDGGPCPKHAEDPKVEVQSPERLRAISGVYAEHEEFAGGRGCSCMPYSDDPQAFEGSRVMLDEPWEVHIGRAILVRLTREGLI